MEGGTTLKGSGIIGGNFRPDAEVRIKLYDFKRPDKFSKDQIRTIAVMHATFARLAATQLAAMLRQSAQVNVALVDQLTYQEFLQEVPSPSTLAILEMHPLKGRALLQIDPPIGFAAIDRIFGGTGEAKGLSRDHTDIEFDLLEGLITRILPSLREAWSPLVDLKPRLAGIEVNPLFVRIVPPSEMVVLVSMEAKVGAAQGKINLCLPFLTLEPLIPKLSAVYWYSSRRRPGKQQILPATLANLKVQARIFYETEDLSLKDIGLLKKNGLIRLPRFSGGEAYLETGRRPLIRLKRVRSKAGLSFSVTEASEPEGKESRIQLRPGEPRPEEQEELKHLIREPLEALRGEIQEGIRELRGSIEALQARQDELTDRLSFESGELKPEQPAGVNRSRPFGFIKASDIDLLHTLLSHELPQTIAMVLSCLDSHLAAQLLSKLEEAARAEVVERIAGMDRIAPAVIKRMEESIEEKLRAASAGEYAAPGGAEAAAEILNISSRRVEKEVIESLERENPSLAAEIKARMFVFEDIVVLEDEAIRAVLKSIEKEDLVLALKATDEKTKARILGAVAESEREKLEAELEGLGRVRLTEVEAAQQRIVNVVRTLEESGAIAISRQGESLID